MSHEVETARQYLPEGVVQSTDFYAEVVEQWRQATTIVRERELGRTNMLGYAYVWPPVVTMLFRTATSRGIEPGRVTSTVTVADVPTNPLAAYLEEYGDVNCPSFIVGKDNNRLNSKSMGAYSQDTLARQAMRDPADAILLLARSTASPQRLERAGTVLVYEALKGMDIMREVVYAMADSEFNPHLEALSVDLAPLLEVQTPPTVAQGA